MGNLWLKIKIWTKIVLFSALVIYILLFIFNNANKPLVVWLWFDHKPDTTVNWLIVLTLLAGIVGTMLTGTVWRTIRQIRELKTHNRNMQMQQDLADMKAKAAMLQTKPAPPPAQPPVQPHI